MSWDVVVMNLPKGVSSLGDLPADYEPGPLLGRGELIGGLSVVLPELDFGAKAYADVQREGTIIEIDLGDEDPVSSFMIRLLGGLGGLHVVADILRHFDFRAVDIGTGDILDSDDAFAAFEAWAKYRDRALKTDRNLSVSPRDDA